MFNSKFCFVECTGTIYSMLKTARGLYFASKDLNGKIQLSQTIVFKYNWSRYLLLRFSHQVH